MSITIRLTDGELRYAAYGGVDRQVSALSHRRNDQFVPRDYWGTHIRACMAELAVAKWRRHYWFPFYERGFHDIVDVGQVEVRSSPNFGSDLVLRKRDREKGDLPFVLVVTDEPAFHVVGWAYGREAMVDDYWREVDPPAWFMPQDRLHTVGTATQEAA